MVQKQLDFEKFAYKKKESKKQKSSSDDDELMQDDIENVIDESKVEEKTKPKRKIARKRKSEKLKNSSEDEVEEEKPKKAKKSVKSSPKKKQKRSKNIISDDEDDDDFIAKEDVAASDNEVELVSENEASLLHNSDSESEKPTVSKTKSKKKSISKPSSKASKTSDKKNSIEKSPKISPEKKASTSSTPAVQFAPIDLSQYRFSTDKSTSAKRDETRKKEFYKLLKHYDVEEEKRKAAAAAALAAEDHDMEEEHTEEQQSSKSKKAKKEDSAKLTPLEQQVFELKKKHPGVVMLVEVGYKYIFFEDDARVASNVLGIVSFKQGNFTKAVIPIYRLGIHLRKIVGAGYKVGIINQTETAMIKASSGNKQGPFTRDLEGIYSKGTLVLGDSVNEHGTTQDNVGYLVSIFEKTSNSTDRIKIYIVAVNVSTGEVLYDAFDDTFMRRELDSRLCQLDISEFILPESQLSEETEKLLKSNSYTLIGEPRYERIPEYHFGSNAKNEVEEFYSKKEQDEVDEITYFEQLSKSILALPDGIIGCINALIEYMKQFKLEKMLRIPNSVSLKPMSSITKVLLSGITLRNLEIFRNSTNGEERGSLFSVLNHTKSSFGRRLLKEWISHPLVNKKEIQQRLDAVEELASGKIECLKSVPIMLKLLPDLEKSLMKTFYKKCSPKEFLIMLKAFERVYQDMPKKEEWEGEIKSELLRSILDTIPENLNEYINSFLESFSHEAAMAGEKSRLFFDNCSPTKFPEIYEHSRVVSEFNKKLDKELTELRNLVEKQNLEYKEWKNEHYVVELTLNQAKKIPSKYVMVHQTKTLQRFQLKFVQEKAADMKFHKEKLEHATAGAWDMLLADFSEEFANFRDLVDRLAALDCLFSFAHVATKFNYCKPELTDKLDLELVKARHPVIEQILDEPFVPNNIAMSNEKCRAILLTGPNLGGKSTISRTIALNALLAQIGSFVPCQKAVLPIFDGIYIRMGASDSIFEGKSTFYVELSETAEIIRRASPRSLVILDELGRGTSTFDGKCLAYATLEYFVTAIQSFTIFVTHYQSLVTLAQKYSEIQNYHMGFVIHDEEEEQEQLEGAPKVTFTYTLKKGFAKKSFGLNVARLAGIPPSILKVAAQQSNEFEEYLHKLEASSIYIHCTNLLEQIGEKKIESEQLEELKELHLDAKELQSRAELFK